MELILISVLLVAVGAYYLYDWLRWQKIPTLNQYVFHNPECKTNRGIKCRNCNSMSIKNWGQKNANDNRRIFICNHCGNHLYRSGH